ncbi:MAG: glycosyltransferase family 8 protein [Planctomycetota bacterium]
MVAPTGTKPIYVAMAADEGFAMPLAATVRSLLETLASDRRLHLFIIDGGIEPRTASRLRSSWADFDFQLSFVQPDVENLRKADTSGHVSISTYFRLLIPDLLPPEISEVIYLDADLLVRRNLGDLWDEPFGKSWCLASQDCAAPYINVREALPKNHRCARLVATRTPIPNYLALGLDACLPYYNCGVMRLDLARWRELSLTEKLLKCLSDNADSLLWWDQYALNVEIAGHWGPLDLRWNQGAHVFRYPNWQCSPFEREVFENLRVDPWIVHFSSPVKPWHAWCNHPFHAEFTAVLDRTDWKGTRPSFRDYASRVFPLCYNAIAQRCRITTETCVSIFKNGVN